MTNVTVLTSSDIKGCNRVSVRTSGNRVYVLITSAVTLAMQKGNVTGTPTSFSTADSIGSITGLVDIGGAVAIDSSNIIHCVYYEIDEGHGGIIAVRYVTFDTGTDSFGTPETVATLDNDAIDPDNLGITIDVNDDPHVFWKDALTDMGSTTYTIWYSNKISGWSTRVSVDDNTNPDAVTDGDILIGEPTSAIGADRPIILIRDTITGSQELRAYHGTALNATGFTEAADITGTVVPINSTILTISFAIDSGGKITVAFIPTTTLNLTIVEHLASAAWGTWETPVDVDTSTNYQSPSIAINGTDRYIFVEDSTNNDINLWVDTGSGFSEITDTGLPNVGSFNFVKAKWASYNNNSPTKFDYVFENSGGAVLYNSYPDEVPPPLVADFNWHGYIPQPLF